MDITNDTLQVPAIVSDAGDVVKNAVVEAEKVLETITNEATRTIIGVPSQAVQLFNEVVDTSNDLNPILQQIILNVRKTGSETFDFAKQLATNTIREVGNALVLTLNETEKSLTTIITRTGEEISSNADAAEANTRESSNTFNLSFSQLTDQLTTDIKNPIDNVTSHVNQKLSEATTIVNNVTEGTKNAVKNEIGIIGKELGNKLSDVESDINDIYSKALSKEETLCSSLMDKVNEITSPVSENLQAVEANSKLEIQNITSENLSKSGDVINYGQEKLQAAVQEITDRVETEYNNAISFLEQEWNDIKNDVKTNFKTQLNNAIKEIKKEATGIFTTATDALGECEKAVKQAYTEIRDQAVGVVNNMIGKSITKIKDGVVNEIKELTPPINNFITTQKEKALNTITKYKEKIKKKIEAWDEKLNGTTEEGAAKALDTASGKDTTAVQKDKNKTEDKTKDTSEKSNNATSTTPKSATPVSSGVRDNFAFKGELDVGGHRYGVVECTYQFFQTVDETGKPISRPQGGRITFVTPSMSDDDLFFYKWMVNKTEVKSGYFRFDVFSYHNKRSNKTVFFKNAYCVELKDYFNDKDNRLMYSTIVITAEVITIGVNGGVVFSNEWT